MKKTVVVNLEYMRPLGCGRSRSRSRSRTQSPHNAVNRIVTSAIEKSDLCDEYDFDEPLDIKAMLHNEHDDISDNDNDNDNDDDNDDNYDNDDNEDDNDDDEESLTSASPSSPSPSPSPSNTRKQYQHPSIKDSDYAVDSDDDLLQSVLDEPTFHLDVNAILSAMTKSENMTIANMTLSKIAARRQEVLSSMNLTPEKYAEFERKLHMYRVIEHPDELKHNQLIRWIPLRSLETRPYVTLGGCLFRVKYNEEEALHIVTLRNVKKFIFNIKFELNAVFQRLSQEELLILRAVEYVESED